MCGRGSAARRGLAASSRGALQGEARLVPDERRAEAERLFWERARPHGLTASLVAMRQREQKRKRRDESWVRAVPEQEAREAYAAAETTSSKLNALVIGDVLLSRWEMETQCKGKTHGVAWQALPRAPQQQVRLMWCCS